MVSLALTHICALRTQTPLALNFSAWNRTSFKTLLHAGQLKTQSIYIGENTAIILALFCHPQKILGFPLSYIWISESRITDWRLPAQSSVRGSKVKGEKKWATRVVILWFSVLQPDQSMLQLQQDTSWKHTVPSRTTHLLEITVFSFFKWAYMHYSLVCFPPGLFGYSEVTMIPAGATHIRVTDNSANYLG